MGTSLSFFSLFTPSSRKSRSSRRRPRRKLELTPQCEQLEIKIAPATLTWTGGGGNALWSTISNWTVDSGGQRAPSTGDSLVFPSVTNEVSTNNLNGLQLASIDIQDAGYDLKGSALSLSGDLTYSGSGSADYEIPTVFTGSGTISTTSAPLNVEGQVTLNKDGSATLETGTLDSAGKATFTTTSALAVGLHSSITAVYGSDASFNGSTSPAVTETVNKANTKTALIASPSSSVFGQSVTFTATVTGASKPTGSVTFMEGSTTLGSRTLNVSGKATFVISTLAVGPHSITAVYGGNTIFSGSTSPAVTETVGKANTTTALIASPKSSVFGQSVTFTATTSATKPGAGTPTGTVTFKDGSTTLGTGTLSGGVATFTTTSALAVGSHSSITAVYGSNASFKGSTSPAVTETVGKANTTTVVTSSLNPSTVGQSVTFTATLTAVSPGTGVPTGTVTFKDGSTTLSTGTLNSSGFATFTTSTLLVATHSITAVYAASTNYKTSRSAALSQVVNKARTTPTITSPPTASGITYGQRLASSTLSGGKASVAGSFAWLTVTDTVAVTEL